MLPIWVAQSLKPQFTADGKLSLRLRRPWRDGTQAIRLEPSERFNPASDIRL